jgi:hypothetical protein
MRKSRIRFRPYLVKALREERHQSYRRQQALEAVRIREQLEDIPVPHTAPDPDHAVPKF